MSPFEPPPFPCSSIYKSMRSCQSIVLLSYSLFFLHLLSLSNGDAQYDTRLWSCCGGRRGLAGCSLTPPLNVSGALLSLLKKWRTRRRRIENVKTSQELSAAKTVTAAKLTPTLAPIWHKRMICFGRPGRPGRQYIESWRNRDLLLSSFPSPCTHGLPCSWPLFNGRNVASNPSCWNVYLAYLDMLVLKLVVTLRVRYSRVLDWTWVDLTGPMGSARKKKDDYH